MVCHELRRPLTVIRGAATLLMESHDQLPAGSRAQILGLIDQSARTMADLVDDLALVGRLEAGQLQVALEPVEVGELIETAVDAVGKRNPQALLTFVKPRQLTVEADPVQSARVLRALLSAALQRSPEGSGPELSAEAFGARVRILVALPAGVTLEEDPGPGPEPFSPFEADLGLPLYLSRGLARLMSGEVTVIALPGGRSAFSFNLNRRV
jgi:signal transduction histidine kinase